MRWLLIDSGLILLTFVALGALAYRVFGRVRLVNAEVATLQNRLSGLSDETAALAARLDSAEVTAKLSKRASA